jgi:hypothetical protein
MDPCLSTLLTIVPATVQNFVAFAGLSVTSINTYTFNDTISVSKTLSTDSTDFCGPKTLKFTLNSQRTTYLTGSNAGYIVFCPSSDASPIFEQVAQLTATIENYPIIESIPLLFTATILKVTVPVISDQIYQVGSPLLTVSFDVF